MNRFAKIAIAALAGTASLVATMDTASARRLNDREVIGLGLLGVAAGALIIGSQNRHRPQPIAHHRPHPRSHHLPPRF